MDLNYWFDFLEDMSPEGVLLTIIILIVTGFLALLTTPYSNSFMRAKRNALIEDGYRKRFKK